MVDLGVATDRAGGAPAAKATAPECSCGPSAPRYCEACALAKEREALGLARDQQAAALCLSGGGIRSAALCLGVLQVLADNHLLRCFHYLSTVSGGGFIGGWLTRSLAALGEGSESKKVDIGDFEEQLAGRRPEELEQLARLRRYTNYLTPQPGLASPDTWAGVLLWIRNTIVNWMVFVPLMAAFAAVPVAWFAATCTMIEAGRAVVSTAVALGLLGLAFLALGVYLSIIQLPSHSHPDEAPQSETKIRLGWDGRHVHRWIVAPVVAWCLLATLATAPALHSASKHDQMRPIFTAAAEHGAGTAAASPTINGAAAPQDEQEWWLAVVGLPVAAFVVSSLAYVAAGASVVTLTEYEDAENYRRHRDAFRVNCLPWLASSFASSSLLSLGLYEAAGFPPFVFALAGPVWVAMTEVVRSTCYVAFRRKALRGELDREWLARLNGTKLVVVGTAGIVGAAAVVLPSYLPPLLALCSGLASGLLAALAGKSVKTAFDPVRAMGALRAYMGLAASLAALAFAAFLLAVFGGWVAGAAWWLAGQRDDGAINPYLRTAIAASGIAAGGCVIALLLGKWIDLEKFSMHAVYRNRLTRAFLGTARDDKVRRVDSYTGFDPNDDVRVSDAFNNRNPPRLFHVINVAVNATTVSDSARAERKAAPFTITPLSCGWAPLHAGLVEGGYIDTKAFDGRGRETGPKDKKFGITLGRALALSGAAVSPNMGYHSSPLVAFVMTLFNVRLGAWLPNPGGSLTLDQMNDGSQANEVGTLLKELLGASSLTDKYIYLSDGGHFDNLGLYEMLRRRCGMIVVIDAGQDKDYGFHDLGSTLRKARIDMEVTVDFEQTIDVGNRAAPMKGGFAKVKYGRGAEAKTGFILYLKAWMPEAAPIELKSFKSQKSSFPHESTGNQFFSESDFESYRRLGEHLAQEVVRTASSGIRNLSLAQLFDSLVKSSAVH